MKANYIQPGQVVEMTTESTQHRNCYTSTVLHADGTRLQISIPELRGLQVPLQAGSHLSVRITTGQGPLLFDTQVLFRSTTGDALVLSLPEHFLIRPDGSIVPGKCIFTAVTSGKGGVGKTGFTINYAIALAEAGKRVLVFDADLGMANVDVLLKTASRFSIVDVLDGQRSMHEVITVTDYGIDIIAGGSGMAKLGALNPTQLQRIIQGFQWLESRYDHVLIDTGAGLSKNVTAFVLAADETIIVTTPDPHAITDAYSIVKVILEEDRQVKLKLLINKCDSNHEGMEVMKRVTRVIRNFLDYNVTPIGCIPESKAMSRSMREQVPFMISKPESDVARCLRSMAETEILAHPVAESSIEPQTKEPSHFLGRLMRRIRLA